MTNIDGHITKLIAVYARVSTSRQEEDGTIETQLVALREFATQNGYKIVREYLDDGWSGDILARPELDNLRVDATKKMWEAVLIYDPDRLARRYSYQELILNELNEAGIEVIFVTIPSPKNPEEKILHGVRGLFAEYERAKISERFRLGKVRKVKEGHILVSKPLYGYNYIPKQDGQHGYYEINPQEAAVVRHLFSWVADDGLTLRKVVTKLHDSGIKPRKSTRGGWNTSTLSHLMRNRAYIGEARWGTTIAVVPKNPTHTAKYRRIKKSSRRERPKEEWIASKIPVPAIIDKDLFERTRKQLESNFALCQRNRKNEYLLAGKIKCPCGRKRFGEGPQHGKHLYYRCSDRTLNYPLPPACKERGINARIADTIVWQKVASLMSSPEMIADHLKRWINAKQSNVQVSIEDIDGMKKEIEKLKVQENRYDKAYGSGYYTLEQLKQYTNPVREDITALELRINKAEQEARKQNMGELPSREEINEFAETAGQMLVHLNYKVKRSIVERVIETITGTQEQLLVYGYLPITNHVGLFTNHETVEAIRPQSYVTLHTNDRDRRDTMSNHYSDVAEKRVPFSFTIKLPPPLKRGVDYGFKPNSQQLTKHAA